MVGRPYPAMAVRIYKSVDPSIPEVPGVLIYSVLWSDGTATEVEGPNNFKFRGYDWFSIVDWPDGTTSYYLALR